MAFGSAHKIPNFKYRPEDAGYGSKDNNFCGCRFSISFLNLDEKKITNNTSCRLLSAADNRYMVRDQDPPAPDQRQRIPARGSHRIAYVSHHIRQVSRGFRLGAETALERRRG